MNDTRDSSKTLAGLTPVGTDTIRSEVQHRPPSSRPPAPDMLAEGSRFGNYVVGPCIGEGGMARVYRAQHEGLRRQVALKVLLDGQGRDEGHQRFLREARMIAAIKHPNVVNIFDVGVHQGRPYLVMELLEGVDLDEHIETYGPLDEGMLVDVAIPCVAGLAAVHDAGIVHRDLKPGNIFLCRGRNDEMEPKLLDFGISKLSGPEHMRLTNSKGMLMGTPFYMSPEASKGMEMTPRSDQYALGVVLYEAATGNNPFASASTFGEVVRQVTTGDYQRLGGLDAKLSARMVAIIERAMHLEPNQRFEDMRAMGRELLSLAGQRTRITWGLTFGEASPLARVDDLASLPRPPLPTLPAPSTRKRRYLAPLLLVALAIVIALWMNWPQDEPPIAAQEPDEGNQVALSLRPDSDDSPGESPAAPPENPGEDPAPTAQAEPLARGWADPTGFDGLGDEADGEADDEASSRKAAEAEAVSAAMKTAAKKVVAKKAPKPKKVAARQRRRRPASRAVRKARRAPRATPKPASPPAETARAQDDDTNPDWLISVRQDSDPRRRGPVRGTNNAPILD